MKLPENVKIKKGLWKLFPLSRFKGQAIYPNIYLVKDIYNDLLSDKPSPDNVAILKHEQTHIARQKQIGWIKWGLKYILLPKFRFNEELQAIKSSMKYLKKEKSNFDTERTAKFISSWLYLWCEPYEKAKEELDRAWKEA